MIDVDEALLLVLERATPLPSIPHPTSEALGLVLDEEILADLDLPPFDKALMDGYALRSEDFQKGCRTFQVVEEIHAGKTPSLPVGAGEASLVMTGAPLPQGADAVVMHEVTRRVGDLVHLPQDMELTAGKNRLSRGREMRRGEVVLPRGAFLNPARLGLLASVGRTTVLAVSRPRVDVLPTGDELVDPGEYPGPGQIRNSNGPMLVAMGRSAGAEGRLLPVAPDEPLPLREALSAGLSADVLLVTGGVSAGNRDLVPATLEGLGVTRIFHKIRLKPGKPLWFGVGPTRGDRPGTLVFGLPGNPVSSLVGFVLFVRPALERLAGHRHPADRSVEVRLAGPFRHFGDRPTYHPARLAGLEEGRDRPVATPLNWAGSADLRTVAGADGFVRFPAGDREYLPSEIVRFLPLG